MLGDAILAEPGAVIGFAGPRVIKQTLGQDLPEGFQTSEFLLDHGMLDSVVAPAESQAHREPTAAPHVGPPGGDGVDVALTFSAVRGNPTAAHRLPRRARLSVRAHDRRIQVRPRANDGAARRAGQSRARDTRRSTSPARTGRGAAWRRWPRCSRAKGLRVATYTSPHLVDFRERMVVGRRADPVGRRRRVHRDAHCR